MNRATPSRQSIHQSISRNTFSATSVPSAECRWLINGLGPGHMIRGDRACPLPQYMSGAVWSCLHPRHFHHFSAVLLVPINLKNFEFQINLIGILLALSTHTHTHTPGKVPSGRLAPREQPRSLAEESLPSCLLFTFCAALANFKAISLA